MRKTAGPAAGSVGYWLTHDEPVGVLVGDFADVLGATDSARTPRERDLRIVRPGMRFIPDATYGERTANDDEPVVWEFADLEEPDFELSDFPYYAPDDTPANWETALEEDGCDCGCGRPKAPKRRLSWACIKRKQRGNVDNTGLPVAARSKMDSEGMSSPCTRPGTPSNTFHQP